MLLSMEHAGCEPGESCLVGRGSAGRLLQPPGCPAGSGGLALHIQADQLSSRPAGCALCSGAVLLQKRTSNISTRFASCPAQHLLLMMALSRIALYHAVILICRRTEILAAQLQGSGASSGTWNPPTLPFLL